MRGRQKLVLLSSVLWLLMSTAIFAEATAQSELQALRKTADYQRGVSAMAQNTTAWINNRCDGAKATFADVIGMLQAPTFDDKGQPLSGAWVEHVTMRGCGVERRLNVLLAVKQPSRFSGVSLLPGTTRANPKLEMDASGYALAIARVDRNGCKPIYIFDTQFLEFSAEKPRIEGKPAWSERWTVAQCDRRIPVDMRFVPDVNGVAIVASLPKATP